MQVAVFHSPFGEWRVASAAPPLDLAPYVNELWETRGAVGYGYEKLLPRGTAEFMVNLGPPQNVLQLPIDPEPATYRGAWLAGIHGGPLLTAPAHGNGDFITHFVGASLKPEGVFGLFGIEAIETANRVFEAEDLIGSDARALRDRMGEAPNTEPRFAALCALLRLQLSRRTRAVPFAAVWAKERTLALRGNLRIRSLCEELSVSRKHLNVLYRRTVGLSPKTFARLARFRGVMSRLQSSTESWATIAVGEGYYDQPHLVRDFRQFAGEAPEAFLRDRGPDGESVAYSERPDQGRN